MAKYDSNQHLARPSVASTTGGASLLSLSGVFVQLADVDPWRSSLWRQVYAVPALLALAAWSRRRGGSTSGLLALPFVAIGLVEGAEVVAYHASVARIGVGPATVLVSTQPIFTGVLAALVLRERPSHRSLMAVPLGLAGVWLISRGGADGLDTDPVGVALGLASAAMYATYLVSLRSAQRRRPGTHVTSVQASSTVGAVVATGAAALVVGAAAPAATVGANAWLLLLALNTPVLGWLLVTVALPRLRTMTSSLLLLLQPALAVVWGALLFDEPLPASRLVGITCVLVAAVLGARDDTRA